MEEETRMAEREPERPEFVFPDLKLVQLDQLEGDGVNIQCVNSSEFVVGKQTNFNGPVTIINCENIPDVAKEDGREKIVIRDKVLSKSAADSVQKMARKEEIAGAGSSKTKEDNWRGSVAKRWRHVLAGLLLVGILAVLAATAGVLFFRKEIPDERQTLPKCIPIARREGNSCLYSAFSWGGRAGLEDARPAEVPVPYVVVAYTHGRECYFVENCLEVLREFQQEEGNRSGCNFLVGSEGNIYQDLGWRARNAVEGPAAGKNVRLCLMGDYGAGDVPTYPQVEGLKAFIEHGVRSQSISRNYSLVASNATTPGDFIYETYNIIKKWKNFRESLGPRGAGGSDESSVSVVEEEALPGQRIYSKADWGGLPATSFIEMKLPVPYVVISHSVSPQCFDLEACSALIRNMQQYHFFLQYADIAYNFLVDSSGNVYEGRGWSRRNVKGGFVNGRNVNINLIGDYSEDSVPTPEQLDGAKSLIERGVREGKLSRNYFLLPDNATAATLSPGKNVYARIKYWPRFDPHPKAHLVEFEE